VQTQNTLYGISSGADLRTIEATFGKPSQKIKFDDGWVAVVYQLKKHNLVVETAPDDPEYVIAVQISGESNPDGKGLLSINLGNSIDSALAVFGTPTERRPSMDEKTNKSIPDAYIYQYEKASFESTKGKITSIKIHFESRGASNLVPKTEIKPVGLLQYTYERWQAFAEEKYNCQRPYVISAQPNPVRTKGVISERWQTDVCGQQRIFIPILVPDGSGGYLVSFGE
jgi:hypothetical protein